jgi:hypothetical protein
MPTKPPNQEKKKQPKKVVRPLKKSELESAKGGRRLARRPDGNV